MSVAVLPTEVIAIPSSVPGFPTLKLDIEHMIAYRDACVAACVGYGLGAKCPEGRLGQLPIEFHAIDCSGFVRSAIAAGTGGRLIVPDGSVVQHDWCRAQGFKPTSYDNCELHDGHVRIAFHAPNAADNIGHVWLDYNGMTLESWGCHGPGSRPVASAILDRLVTAVYVLA